MSGALTGFAVEGVPTTIDFHRSVMGHEDFRASRVTTRWVEETFMKPAEAAAGVGVGSGAKGASP
jgi:biotin carboxylase